MYRIHHVDPVMSYIPWHVLIALSCLTLCNPLDCSPPGSCVHGILQARILEQVSMPFPGIQTHIALRKCRQSRSKKTDVVRNLYMASHSASFQLCDLGLSNHLPYLRPHSFSQMGTIRAALPATQCLYDLKGGSIWGNCIECSTNRRLCDYCVGQMANLVSHSFPNLLSGGHFDL